MTAAVHQGRGWAQPAPATASGPAPGVEAGPTLQDRLSWIGQQLGRVPGEQALHLIGLGLVTGVFRVIDAQGPWLWWLALCLSAWALRAYLHRRLCSGPDWENPAALLRWDGRHRALLLLQGALTGLACAMYQPLASGANQSTLLIVVFVCVAGAIPSLLHRLRLFAVYAGVTAGPLAVAVVLDTADADHLHLVGSLVLLLVLVAWLLGSHLALVRHLLLQKARVEGMRREMSEQAAHAQAARLAAEVANQAKTHLIAAASHDLRQPLLALNLYGLRLRARLCEPRDLEVLDGVARGVQALETMLSDLLDYARCEAGAVAPRLQPIRVDTLYRRLLPQVAPSAFDRGLRLAWRGGHHTLWGDPVMVERCLRNLILNAVHHTDSGGVLVGARLRGGEVLLQVWDSGCGLHPQEQARVFEDHYQVPSESAPLAHRRQPLHAATATETETATSADAPRQGTGLGLGIVRRFSHLMGARVGLRSSVGRGTVFELAFRAQAGSAA